MLKCKVCGQEFQAKAENHYISRDNVRTELFASCDEVRIYDTFDCPVCASQYVAQERKRDFSRVPAFANGEDDEAEDVNSGEEEA